MKVTQTIRITQEGDDAWHIPGVHNTQQTLCGYVDCMYEASDFESNPVNCYACIDALKKIKALRFPKGYFKP